MSLTHSTTLNILLNCFDEAMMSLHCFIEHNRFFAAKFAFCCITQELPYRPGFENGLVLNLFFSLQVCIRIRKRMLKILILVCSILVDPARECLFKPPDAVKIKERARIFNDLKNGMFFRHIEHCALSSSKIIKNGIGDDIARAKGPILTIF